MEDKRNQGMYDMYEEYKETLKVCKKPLVKRQNMNREIRETYDEPFKRTDYNLNKNDISDWNSMIREIECDMKEIENYLNFEDRHYMHKEYNDTKSMILNPNSNEGVMPVDCLSGELDSDVADIVCDVEFQNEIVDLLGEILTKRQKQVVNLYFWEGRTQEQIAGILGIAQQNVQAYLQNGLKKLKNSEKVRFLYENR